MAMRWVMVQAVVPDKYPDQGLPGPQPPVVGHPEHPIVQPEPPLGIWGPPQMPPGFWGGGMGPGVRPQPPAGAHPEHPIYIPITPPPESGLEPTHPIYIPIYPAHPIVLPPEEAIPPKPGIPPETIERIKQVVEFLTGNLPENPNPNPEPVTTQPKTQE